MCLGVPALVITIEDDRGTPMADVDFAGVNRRVCLAYTPDAAVGDYVIVHAGFAISRLDQAAAAESLQYFEEMGLVEPAAEDASA